MKYLFDSSAIYTALIPEMVGKLVGNYTLDLAKYEIGNIVWKERTLHKKMTETEQEKVIDLAVDALQAMGIFSIKGHEKRILALATRVGLSFYDASYAYFANAMNLPLVTVDKKFATKVKGYVDLKDIQGI